MELLEQIVSAPPVPLSPPSTDVDAQRAARRTLRSQIARLERELADAFVTAYPMGGLQHPDESANRLYLERMLLDPASHRYARVSRADLGEPGCGVWQVKPRLGLIGMLMGWWEVKLSSGCPLAGGRGGFGRRDP